MKTNTEIELKLSISRENLKKMLALPLMKKCLHKDTKTVRRLITSYYDTPEMVLQNNGIAYRVRDKGDGTFEATVKTAKKNVGGVTERLELNLPLAEDRAELEGFKELGLPLELTELAPQGVEKLFTVNVQRTTYLLYYGAAVIELAIDRGNILADKAKAPVEEIEFELKEGEVPELLAFAAELAAQVPLFVEMGTKYARGLELRGLPASAPLPEARLSGSNAQLALLGMVQQSGMELCRLSKQLQKGEDGAIAAIAYELQNVKAFLAYAKDGVKLTIEEKLLQGLDAFLELCGQHANLLLLMGSWVDLRSYAEDYLDKDVLSPVLEQELQECRSRLLEKINLGQLTALLFEALSELSQVKEDVSSVKSTLGPCILSWLDADAVPGDALMHACRLAAVAKGKKLGKLFRLLWITLSERELFLEEEGSLTCLSTLVRKCNTKKLYAACSLLKGYVLHEGMMNAYTLKFKELNMQKVYKLLQ